MFSLNPILLMCWYFLLIWFFHPLLGPLTHSHFSSLSLISFKHVIFPLDLIYHFFRRLLRVLWTTRRSNQSILKEINPEYSLEGLVLKLKLQYFGHLRRRVNSLEKTPILGKIEVKGERGMTEDEMVGCHHWLNRLEFEQTPGNGEGQGSLTCCSPWGHKELDMS